MENVIDSLKLLSGVVVLLNKKLQLINIPRTFYGLISFMISILTCSHKIYKLHTYKMKWLAIKYIRRPDLRASNFAKA